MIPPPPDVLCIGETMALLVPSAGNTLTDGRSFVLSLAGAESNVAMHLAGLGVRAAWVSALGADPLGERVRAAVTSAGVDTRWVTLRPDSPTGLMLKDPAPYGSSVWYYRTGSAASQLGPADADGWPLGACALVHLTGITPALSPGCHALVERLLDSRGARPYRVSFDVNYRSRLWPDADAADRIRRLADRADIVLVGLDEAHALWGCQNAQDVAEVLPSAHLLVVKDGPNEAVEFSRAPESVVRVPAHRVDVVDPVGAGDAFAGGYLAGLLGGLESTARLRLAHDLAAWTMGSHEDVRPGHDLQVARAT